jgi:hypothetical protein
MVYVKRALGAVAALTIALVLEYVDMAWYHHVDMIWHGHGASVDLFFAIGWGIRDPAVWAVAFLLFLLFIKSSQLHSKALRVLLFWTPTLVSSTLAFLVTALLTWMDWTIRSSMR